MQPTTQHFRSLLILGAFALSSSCFAWGSAPPSNPSNPGNPGSPTNPKPPSSPSNPSNPSNPTNPSKPDAAAIVSDITQIASSSSCAAYTWQNRGRAPAGYMQGMAVTFAKSLCRQRQGETPATLMASKNSGNSDRDALTWYESTFDARKLEIDLSGSETLRSLYTLGIGLGMRESSGKHCQGYDVSASAPPTATTAEAGLFQTSHNSTNVSAELRKVYAEYKADRSKCYLDIYKKGVSCPERASVGTGDGFEFQELAKSCPAFAAEYAMLNLRVLRKHYGPINRKEAELNASCNQMLDQVQDYVESRAANVCEVL